MIQPNAEFTEAIVAAVARIEATTDAELVVVAAGRSGSYRDLAAGAAGLLTLLALFAVSMSPLVFSPYILPIELAVLAGLLTWLIDRSPWLLRWLVSPTRAGAQVDAAAAAVFTQERVYSTPERIGVLIYLSALESQVRVLADSGIERPDISWDITTTEAFVACLERLGAELATRHPALPDTNADHLSNAPRVRP